LEAAAQLDLGQSAQVAAVLVEIWLGHVP
jgi:hypothetical protein